MQKKEQSQNRVLVCGGRDYNDVKRLELCLNLFHLKKGGIAVVIYGYAQGADTLAAEWAEKHNIPTEAYPADWKRHGKSAGPIRNRQMLTEGKPDAIIAFPGGAGTKDMINAGKKAGVKVYIVP